MIMIPVKTIGLNDDGSFIQVPISMEEYREICASHYCMPAEFFKLFLDSEHLAYSCGVWEGEGCTLEQSMTNKYKMFSDFLGDARDILEVGSGFGGLSRYLAKPPRHITAYNISKTQHDYCEENARWNNIYHNKCWTEIEGTYDAIVSDEFIVHVPDGCREFFFTKLRSHLDVDGVLVLKNLSSVDPCNGEMALANNAIFGHAGEYPTQEETLRCAKAAGFEVVETIIIPNEHYKKTAAAWQRGLFDNSNKLKEMNKELRKKCGLMFAIYQKALSREPQLLAIHMTKFKAV